jgi:hypothetical protein
MSISGALKEGFSVVNRNWQLVLVNLAFSVLTMILLGVMVVLPLAFVSVMKGVDLMLLRDIRSLEDLFSSVPIAVVPVLTVIFIYFLVILTAGFYILAGALGVIFGSVRDPDQRFSLKGFFQEANRLFWPVLGYSALVGLVGIGILIGGGILAGAFSVLTMYIKNISQIAAAVVASMLCIVAVVASVAGFFLFLALTVYGTVAVCTGPYRGFSALKEAKDFLIKHPQAFWLYIIATGIYCVVAFLLGLIGLPFRFIPYGFVVYFPYQVFVTAVQGYAAYWIMAVAVVYYYTVRIKGPSETGEPVS